MCLAALANLCCPCWFSKPKFDILDDDNLDQKIQRISKIITPEIAIFDQVRAINKKNYEKIEEYIRDCRKDNISEENLLILKDLLEKFYFEPMTDISLEAINQLIEKYFIEAYIKNCEKLKLQIDQVDDIEDLLHEKNRDINKINILRDYFIQVNKILEKYKNITCKLPPMFDINLQEKINDRIDPDNIEKFIKEEITQFELASSFQAHKKKQEQKFQEKSIEGLTFEAYEMLLNDPGFEIVEHGKSFQSKRSCSISKQKKISPTNETPILKLLSSDKFSDEK